MSSASCALEPVSDAASICPGGDHKGTAVSFTTVAALIRGKIPRRQEFHLCRDTSCPIVYFGSEGTTVRADELRVRPGFKDGGDGLLCYCFEVRESDLASQIGDTGRSSVLDDITAEVMAGNCACEVRNPGGGCCLGELSRALRRLEREAGALA